MPWSGEASFFETFYILSVFLLMQILCIITDLFITSKINF